MIEEGLEPSVGGPVLVEAAAARWLAVVSHLDPRYGGLSAAVPRLVREIEGQEVDMSLAAFCAPGEFTVPVGFSERGLSHWPTSRRDWLRDPALLDGFRKAMKGVDGTHVHGLWEQSTAVACKVARELGKPYVVSAHGMLEPWALKNKRLKKYLYAALFERDHIRCAACLHALTLSEARQYRHFGARGPVVVIPNGVTVPPRLSPDLFLQEFPELKGKRLLLFMSRLHPKKGIDLLVAAWSALAERWPEAHLVIAGPDFEDTRAKIERMVAGQGLRERVLFTGMLEEAMKWSALAAAECFVLPSYSEGLSMSALEALGAGLPVIVTKACNMPEVTSLDLGWEVEATVQALSAAMREMLESPCATNRETGSRGKRLIEGTYTWPIVAAQMAEIYRWVMGGPSPERVEVLRG